LNQPLLIASANLEKINEIQAILSPQLANITTAKDLALSIEVEETGQTYSENARLKASAYLQATGFPALADDTGLEVDALQGAPGIYSNRFAPIANPTYADHRKHLLAELRNKPQPWTAHFSVVVVLALPDGQFIETTGRCDGIIIPKEIGSGGFGYDPIFYLPKLGATMAELPSAMKNQISHRAHALKAMLPTLIQLFNNRISE